MRCRKHTVISFSFQTARSWQTVQNLIRLLLQVQSDQGLHCLQFCQYLLKTCISLLYSQYLFEFEGITATFCVSKIFGKLL